MLYLSQLLSAQVENSQHERVGKILDVVIPLTQDEQSKAVYPSVLLVESDADQTWRVLLDQVERQEDVLRLLAPLEQFDQHIPSEQEVRLAQDVLDKQVIDVEHKKAVRVNDICLADDWRILGVDNTTLGLLRRLAPVWLLGTKGRSSPASFIPWEDIELISARRLEERLISTVPSRQSGPLSELHPADIAAIVHQLTPSQGARLIERLDDETAADTMEETDTDRQRSILENIEPKRAADILEAMEPDEAADLLAQIPEEHAQELLRLMTPEESEDVQELLEYEENSAGGLMTTDFIILNSTRTAAEALEVVRVNIRENDIYASYVYCVNDETQEKCRILGIVSLWELLVAAPTQSLRELMETDVITVRSDENPRTVAEIMAKYNLLAVPVVSDEGMLEGIVTVDDALDVLLPAERRRKAYRMY